MSFVNMHRLTTNMTFGVGEKEETRPFERREVEGLVAIFSK